MTKYAIVGAEESVGREILSFMEEDSIKASNVFAVDVNAPLGTQVSYGEDEELDVHNLGFAAGCLALGAFGLVGMQAVFKPVDVVYQGDTYYLVEPAKLADDTENTSSSRLREGDSVLITAMELYDGKVLEA